MGFLPIDAKMKWPTPSLKLTISLSLFLHLILRNPWKNSLHGLLFKKWKAEPLVPVNLHWMFILNKHSTSLSNTSCILRPFEDREKYADDSDFEQCQRGINLFICSAPCQCTSRQTSKSVLTCSASLGLRECHRLSNYLDTENNWISAVECWNEFTQKRSKALQQDVSLSPWWRKGRNKLLFHGKPLHHHSMYPIGGPGN